jgi:hypothetical protein
MGVTQNMGVCPKNQTKCKEEKRMKKSEPTTRTVDIVTGLEGRQTEIQP